MRAVQLTAPGRPLTDAVVEPAPVGPGQVRVDVTAAGICRSDLHYRAGFPPISDLPRTLGHEIAGVVAERGAGATLEMGTRVGVHYLDSCGECSFCSDGVEQFCARGAMLGKELDGGFAESVVVPERNAIPIPGSVSDRAAAVMMCSTATVLHALRVGGVTDASTVVVFGAGGLGQSAIQLASHLGKRVVAVDPSPAKRELATAFGAIAVDAGDDPVAAVRGVIDQGADVVLDLVGSAAVMRTALDVLAPMGRAVAVGLTAETLAVGPYTDLVTGERALIGSSDHLRSEIVELFSLASDGVIDTERVITGSVPLEAAALNETLDRMAMWSDDVRTVVER